MQPVSTLRRPQIAQAIDLLRQQGAFCAQMTGSGSAVIAAFTDAAAADAALASAKALWPRAWRCESCMKGMVIHHDD